METKVCCLARSTFCGILHRQVFKHSCKSNFFMDKCASLTFENQYKRFIRGRIEEIKDLKIKYKKIPKKISKNFQSSLEFLIYADENEDEQEIIEE